MPDRFQPLDCEFSASKPHAELALWTVAHHSQSLRNEADVFAALYILSPFRVVLVADGHGIVDATNAEISYEGKEVQRTIR